MEKEHVIISDIHLEFYPGKSGNELFKKILGDRDYSSYILLICGDLGYPSKANYWEFLKECNNRFEKTFFITGNHEYYTLYNDKAPIQAVNELIALKSLEYPNIHFLNEAIWEHNGIVYIGCTLWTSILTWEKAQVFLTMADFQSIYSTQGKLLTTREVSLMHGKQLVWLLSQLPKGPSDKKYIVMTHHLPTDKLISPDYPDLGVNSAYYTNLESLFRDYKMDAWVSGHTHKPMEVQLGQCLLKTNPYGYPGENPNFQIRTLIL